MFSCTCMGVCEIFEAAGESRHPLSIIPDQPFWYQQNLAEMWNVILTIKKWSDFGRISIARSEKKKKEKSPAIYVWFSVCSQKHKMMIKDLFFVSGLQRDFAKSSGDNPHFCCKQKFLERILSQMMTPCEFGFWPRFFVK